MAGYGVMGALSLYFEDGGSGNPDIIYINDSSFLSDQELLDGTWAQAQITGGSGTDTITVDRVDIDGDGDLEIVIAGQTRVYAFHHDGTNVSGWPIFAPGVWSASPIIGDIDGDGDMEILISTSEEYDKFYAFHHDGTNVSGWPKIIPSVSLYGWHWIKWSTPVLALSLIHI